MLKRDLSYELLSRELEALEEFFSREPEDWTEWDKREPFPGNTVSTPEPTRPVNLPVTTSYVSFPSPKPNPGTGVISTITTYFKKT